MKLTRHEPGFYVVQTTMWRTRLGMQMGWEPLGGWSASVTVGRPTRIGVLGWGWDRELPLRPWPQLHRRRKPPGTQYVIGWFGVFINWWIRDQDWRGAQ